MSTVRIDVSSNKVSRINLGVQGENLVESIVFDISKWIEDYGEGVAYIYAKRKGDEEPYPIALDMDMTAKTATWDTTLTDTAAKGKGSAQFVYVVDEDGEVDITEDEIKKTKTYATTVQASIVAVSEENPSGYETWLEILGGYTVRVESAKTAAQAAQAAAEAAQAAAESAETSADSSRELAEMAAMAASQSATSASSSATSAGNSASSASSSASSASSSASSASTSATNAATSASSAASSATSASGSATSASQSASSATSSATSASQSATSASNSASAAAGSATDASASASAAASSESNAATSETNAASSASSASTSATNAANSASSASTSASTATTKASQASTSATNAANSATAAAASASSASADAESIAESAEQIAINKEDIADLKEEINDKPNWTVGSAEQIVSDEASQTDVTPYTFRRSGGGLIPFNFTREELAKVVGGTVAWNQLVQEYYANACTASESSGVITITPSGASNRYRARVTGESGINVIKDHIYFQTVYIKSDGTNSVGYQNYGIEGTRKTTSNSWTRLVQISKASSSASVYFQLQSADGATAYDVKKDTYMVFDLTALFGNPAIADYLYGLSSADSVATWLDTYIPSMLSESHTYDPGSLQSVCVGAHECVGFNAWDEKWEVGQYYDGNGQWNSSGTRVCSKRTNPIKVLPNQQYYVGPATTCIWFDETGKVYNNGAGYIGYNYSGTSGIVTAPSNAKYMRFYKASSYGTTYNHDICINISDPTRNGEYQPYQKHTYALDSTKTLRGYFYLDSNNQLRADGDIYLPSGEVQRKMVQATFDGSESWAGQGTGSKAYFKLKVGDNGSVVNNAIISDKIVQADVRDATEDVGINLINSSGYNGAFIYIRPNDVANTSLATFKTWLSNNPLTVAYELAAPNTETADPYTAVQICDSDGTEEFVDALVEAGTRDVAIPAGTETVYYEDLAGKLADLPPIPSAPSANGTYTLQAVVSSGNVTYSWTS